MSRSLCQPIILSVMPVKDKKTTDVIASMGRISLYGRRGIAALLAFWVLTRFLDVGMGSGAWGLAIAYLLFLLCKRLFDVLILAPLTSIRYAACLKAIRASIAQLGFAPSVEQAWLTPRPGLIAVDAGRRRVFIECEDTGYHQIVLGPGQILGVKIEPGADPAPGSSPPSESKAGSPGEQVVLQLRYALHMQAIPNRVTVPFGANRHQAELMMLAITHL